MLRDDEGSCMGMQLSEVTSLEARAQFAYLTTHALTELESLAGSAVRLQPAGLEAGDWVVRLCGCIATSTVKAASLRQTLCNATCPGRKMYLIKLDVFTELQSCTRDSHPLSTDLSGSNSTYGIT